MDSKTLSNQERNKIKRRKFIQATSLGLAAGLPLFLNCGRGPGGKRPNIVLIMADDMGYSDIGCYGGEVNTPNIDRLAAEGIRFTRFYNAARCCPTRASLLTGLYPHQAGMGDMVSPNSQREPGPYQGYLNDSCVTLAEVLRSAGYRTYMSGKWHVGEAPDYWPRKRGFDRYFGLISGGSSYWELIQTQPNRRRTMALDDTPWDPPPEGFYMTDAFSDYAVNFLDEHIERGGDDPFFMYVPYTAPHWPLHAHDEDIARYLGKFRAGWDELRKERYARMVKMGLIDPSQPLSPRDDEVPPWSEVPDKEHQDRLMAVYAAMIDRMDYGIGRILDRLESMGASDNTLILFLADNGACHENIEGRKLNRPGTLPGERGSYVAYRRPWANYSNTPFRMFKHWVQEGGIATPLIARWPAGIKNRNSMSDEVGHIIDIMPTLAEVGGAEYPGLYEGRYITPSEGKSLLPVLEGGSRRGHDALYWEHEGNRAVRRGKWKLVAEGGGPWELYDMEADRVELNDLSGKMPDKVDELKGLYAAWAAKVGVRD